MKKGLLLSVVLLLGGCIGEEHGDLKAWMEENSQGLHGQVEPLPEVKPYEPFVYNAYDLVDPFSMTKRHVTKKDSSSSEGALAPNLDRPREILESYDLEKLKMVGTLQRGKEIYALIKTPEGSLYRIKPGSYMGQNFGMVTTITEYQVTLKEVVESNYGDWTERTSVLMLEETEQKQ